MPAPLRRRKVTPQLTAIGCLTDQIELVMQVVIELGHDLSRLQAAPVGGQALDQAGQHAQQGKVFLDDLAHARRSEEHTSELQSLMRISYAVLCLKKNKNN